MQDNHTEFTQYRIGNIYSLPVQIFKFPPVKEFFFFPVVEKNSFYLAKKMDFVCVCVKITEMSRK